LNVFKDDRARVFHIGKTRDFVSWYLLMILRYDSTMKTFTSTSLKDTQVIAQEWLKDISKIHFNKDEALVVGLSGHLGAGKTAFSKLVAKEIGINEEITSPTFVIMKMYDIDPKKNEVSWKRLVHIDAYRLERREELGALNWERLVADKGNLILIEWPENVGLKEFDTNADLRFDIREGKYEINIK
jgi:tRNA threonylcarbamoyladenosine biosynthesis protein TsaE